MTALLALTVLASLAVACATLLVDLRRVRSGAVRPLTRRALGTAQAATGLLWLVYGDLALAGAGGARGWFAIAIGALFVLQGVRRLK
ncbi:MAG TPA: hypothetical protein VKV26_11920 [Dehalococcoidia bacterium]|nr:hypothetical protein [Dehalococcoidia bacterium]